MRLPALLRPTPSLQDVEAALKVELGQYADATRQVPNAWSVDLSPRDSRKLTADLARWSSVLGEALVEEHRRLGLTASGLVTVSFPTAGDLPAGTFRIVGAVVVGEPAVLRQEPVVPGRPRLTIAAGGTVAVGTPSAAGIDREVLLPAGTFVIGRDSGADLRLHDATVSPRHLQLEVARDGKKIRLTDLGSLNGTKVDGLAAVMVDLVDGNRIELGATTLLFHRDQDDEDGGRQGGEGE
ncbi:MAG: hypothetical protein QOE84_3562 [Actinomycetota bacterium]|nr:hypothetical protein [Actinomycetota bacterium]